MTDRPEAPKAYSYIRMSTPEQQRGDSMRRQLRASEQFATDNCLELAEIIQDIGVSAFHGRNAEVGSLARFLSAVDDGLVQPGSFLLVESLDRLSRENIPQALTLLNGIVERGITVVTLQDRQRYSPEIIATNPTALLVAVLTMMRAHEESRVKSDRLAAVWNQKKQAARDGKVTGQKLPLWLRYSADKCAIEAIPERTEIVRQIFQRSAGGYGVFSICRWLNTGGSPAWGKAGFFQESYVKKVLTNRAVLGEYQPHRRHLVGGRPVRIPEGEPVQGYYPAVVSPSEYQDVQAAMARRKVNGAGRKGSFVSNLFSGLLQCAHCGGGVGFFYKGAPPKGGSYLRCGRAAAKGGCFAPAFRYDSIEAALLEAVEEIDFEHLLGGTGAKTERVLIAERLATAQHESKRLQGRIANLVQAIAEAAQPIAALTLSIAAESKALSEIEGHAHELNGRLQQLTRFDPDEQRRRVGDFLARQSSADRREKERGRRALSAELRRILARVRIRSSPRFLHELREEPGISKALTAVSDDEFASRIRTRPFEFELIYLQGDVAAVDPLSGARVRIPDSRRQRIAISQWNLKRMADGTERDGADDRSERIEQEANS